MDVFSPGKVDVDGVSIHYEVGGVGPEALLLLHGSRAHLRWWHRVGPSLAERWRVIQMDLSGHGDSGWRGDYDPEAWAREVVGVLEHLSIPQVVLIGHSMGGRVALLAAADHPRIATGVIMIDSIIRANDVPGRGGEPGPRRPPRVHPDYYRVRAAFRVSPPQPFPDARVLDPVADYSLRRVEDGWTWKGDSRVRHRFTDALVREKLREVVCPVAYVYGTESHLAKGDMIDLIPTLTDRPLEMIPVLGSHHHIPLDAPDTCARIIDEVADRWSRGG